MKCSRCQKPLTRAYIQDGPLSWGPKCAKAAGFTRPTGPRASQPQPVEVDPRQIALYFPEPRYAHQGHPYEHNGRRVLAMESGAIVRCRPLDEREPLGIGAAYVVDASDLRDLPLRYLGQSL